MLRAMTGGQPDPAARRQGPSRYTGALVAASLLVLLAGGGVAWAGSSVPARATTTRAVTTTTRATTTTTVAKPKVLSITPVNGSSGVSVTQAIRVKLSGPAQRGAPMPTLTPAVFGSWSEQGRTLLFRPYLGYQPWGREQVSVPSSLAVAAKHSSFGVAGVPLVRVQQLLAELGYLPLHFSSTSAQYADTEPNKASFISPAPQVGSFSWAYKNVPAELSSQWKVAQPNVLTTGAVMHFEAVSGLGTDGVAGPQVWAALKTAAAQRQYDPVPYDYLMTSEVVPEKLAVWRNGSFIYQTPVNTGVPGAATQPGTFPVYIRYLTTEMKGTDPNGTKYDVPNVPWVAYFNGGDAVHGYPRYSYGWPQSNGCVELPIANAQIVWGMDPIGTLVTVTTGPLPTS